MDFVSVTLLHTVKFTSVITDALVRCVSVGLNSYSLFDLFKSLIYDEKSL